MDSYSLKSVSDLPVPFRSIFSFRYFNSLQSECFPICFHSDANMVISAPTGSGKTVLFELCILRLLSKFISEGNFVHVKGTLKTIYIAPHKALVQEKLRDWSQKFGSMGINCLELTGDNEFYNAKTIQEADIILTTPEKFDAVTRYRIKDGGLSFFSDIALLLIDEVHLLNDPRGAALEAIVSRIKMLARNSEMNCSPLSDVRFLAVSATIPNIEDLAEWLNVPVQGIKRFGEEMRPVKLTTKVLGYAPAKNDFLFEKRLQNYIFDILMQYSRGKSALVFCSTRKGAQEAAQHLSHSAMSFGYSNPFVKDRDQQERLREASLSCSDKQMQSYILYGVGYHNGGLCLKDRNLVEGLFLKGDIQILCTTNTLAHGINLPAHTVVIKSTQYFNKEKGTYMEYDRSTVLQMSGRAGRPPFDNTGMVIIMTRRETVHLYENLLSGCERVESQLLPCVTEHLTAEIVQLTVSDISRAIEWMKCSYLYVRMKKNPEKYTVRKVISRDRIEKHMQEIAVQKVNELSHHQMIWTDNDAFLLKPLEPGRLMTKYYLKFDTMKHIMNTPENCSLEDTLKVVCRADELAWIQLRRNEKKLLNDINVDKDGRLRFHINVDKQKRKKRIQSREEKIFVLANDCLTGDPSAHDLSLTQDMNAICSNGSRIAKCMKEYFIFKKNYRGAINSIFLAKSLYQKLWDDSPYQLKQLPGIGMVTAKALHSMGIKSFDALAEADPRRIEIVTGRKFPFGNHIKESLLSLPPKVNFSMEETDCRIQGKRKLLVTLARLSQPSQSFKRHYADMIVGTEEDNLIQFHEKIRVDEFSSPYCVKILLSSPQQQKLTVKADFLFDEYIGLDVHQKLLLMERGNSDTYCNRRLEKHSFFPPAEEVLLIEDDIDTTSHAAAERPSDSAKSELDNSSIPSFKLIDEEVVEGSFLLTRKRHRQDFELNCELNVVEKTEKIRTAKISELDPKLEHGEGKLNEDAISKYNTAAGSLVITRLKDDTGGFPSDPDRSMLKSSAQETVFDHIRKKADNFPVLSRAKKIDYMPWISGFSSQNQDESYIATSDELQGITLDKMTKDAATVISDFEPGALIDKSGNRAGAKVKDNTLSPIPGVTRGSFSAPPKVSSNKADIYPIKILPFDISMIKDKARLTDSSGCMDNSCKQQCSTSVSQSQSSSGEMTGQAREVDPFLGFRSVFSFL